MLFCCKEIFDLRTFCNIEIHIVGHDIMETCHDAEPCKPGRLAQIYYTERITYVPAAVISVKDM